MRQGGGGRGAAVSSMRDSGVRALSRRRRGGSFGAMFGRDYWTEGLTLEDIELDGLDRDGLLHFVQTGER